MNTTVQYFDQQFYGHNTYRTQEKCLNFFDNNFTNASFYARAICGPIFSLCFAAHIGKADDATWTLNSARIGRTLEAVGCNISITGLHYLANMDEPFIVVGNHMSTLETFVLPSIIRPHTPVTFVVKQSLTTMPLFGKVLESRDTIAVGRTNPRQDLQFMLDEGKKRLDNGMSVVIFPQNTRSVEFNPAKFNSIGVKLAKFANRPIIPLALKSDAWAQGSIMKDFGKVYKDKPIRFAFGAPMYINDHGKVEHAKICQFITDHLEQWKKEDNQQ